MAVAEELQPYLAALAEADMPPVETLPLDVIRATGVDFANAARRTPSRSTSSRTARFRGPAGEIPIPCHDPDPEETSPVVAYFHGGGFVFMGIESHDRVCRRLANATNAVVVSVDYRLAPEHCFPVALDDCMAITHWLTHNAAELAGDPAMIAVAGDRRAATLWPRRRSRPATAAPVSPRRC